ncbi:hypothetical protein CTheo_8067 [Ceratobasidium theobromae]|uniref:NACHT domain-containing protein n=1 Tax=Ceratobasidium theobromae TaxID=1582974 RepID=A0A5N5QAR0_9AGAM|nr:hypothetical protein CTheo_8067 [Ceratobasidium theobromae]
MTSPLSPKSKKGVRGFLRERLDNFKSQLRSPSQQFLEVSGSRANSRSPPPTERLHGTVDTQNAGTSAAVGSVGSLPEHTASTPLTKKNRSPAWAGLGSALRDLHKTTRLFPPLQSAVGALISCLDTWEFAMKNDERREDLARELTTLSNSLAQHIQGARLFRMSNCVANVARSIQEQANLLWKKQNDSMGRRLVGANIDEEDLTKHYRKMESLFRQLQTDVNLSTWSIANEQLANTRLEALVPSKPAQHDSSLSVGVSRRTCTEGTRTAILAGLDDWSLDPNAKDIYLMSGMAGTGKTTIACSLSEKLEDRKQLAASFFCARTSPECRHVQRIIPTIAYQLARYSIPFQVALCEILGSDPDVGSRNIGKQFERLLKEPLMAVKDAIPDNLVVVIDALDECDDRNDVERLLDLLFQFAGDIPLRFFITSRPEPEIYKKMISQSPGSRTILHLHEIEKSLVQADITLYLTEELGRFMSPTPDQIEQLSQRSGNLFIYASTLVRYLRLGSRLDDHQKRLDSLLAATSHSTKQYAQLDGLYTTVLRSALNEEELDDEEVEGVRAVLQAAICTQEPVNIETLAVLAGLGDAERARSALQPLRSVLHISENNGLVSTLHASFPDFMFNQERSGPFFCDAAAHSQVLTRQCFSIMRDQLQFNICDLESSFVLDKDVPDLRDRVTKRISSSLYYACRYWADHLGLCKTTEELCSMVYKFLSTRLLFWMEVLNLKEVMSIGMEVLPKTKLWLQAANLLPEVVRLIEDAQNFVTTFTANPVSQSTPHIYTSLLPFSPKTSSISEQYRRRTRGLIEAKGSGMGRRDAAALATWKAGSAIRAVAYSPNGTQIVFGCKNGTIGIRSAHDGSLVVGPIEAHTSDVCGVAFSPSGTQVASCSNDHAVRLWDSQNGLPIAIAFNGHTKSVISVSFSPDGTRIASGSNDRTIRVWDINNDIPPIDPFRGHTSGVKSVAFSPDGTRIVSGSADRTVRVWSSTDGTPVAGPFTGHTDIVRSVAFSPDGTRVVSGSYDHTVRMWSADSGAIIARPLEGHTEGIMSVAFFPDGARIVSASKDRIVRLWNVHRDAPVAGLFEGHTDSVNGVAVSPDGMHVLSGSSDSTIRVWSGSISTSTAIPPEGHAHWVLSTALSPDATRIASGSYDHTIRVWDTQSGTPVTGPLNAHTGAIRSIAFSPDGAFIASGSDDQTVRLWSSRGDRDLFADKIFEGHTNWVMSVAFSPDSVRLVSGSGDRTIRVWSIPEGDLLVGPLDNHTGPVTSVAYSPDGSRIVSGSNDCTIRIWGSDGTPVANPLKGHTEIVRSVSFSPDGAQIVSGSNDCTIRLWEARDGTPAAISPLRGHTATVQSAVFSSDGTKIASSSQDRTVRLWSSSDGTMVGGPFEGHIDRVWSVTLSPDGAFAVTGSSDCTIRVWDIQHVPTADSASGSPNTPPSDLPVSRFTPTNSLGHWSIGEDGTLIASASHDNTIRVCNVLNGTLITKPFKGHNNWVTSIAFSPDGTQVVSGSLDRTIRVWSISNGKRIIGPLNGHSGGVMSVMFSPDGARIVSGSNDRTIRVWNTANGTPIAKPFKGHTRGVKSAAFSPDGALVVSGSEDCTIRLWNTHNGTAPCSPFHGHTAAVYSAAFSPDGAKVISGSDDYTVRLWNSNDGTLIGGPFEGHIDRVWSVAFSPDGASVVSGSNDCTIRVWDTSCISSTGVSVGNSNTPSFQLSTSSLTHVNPFGHWSIKEDGWIKDDDDHLLFWLPPEALRSLITPHCSLVIGRFGSIEVDLSSALLGDRWRECYILE